MHTPEREFRTPKNGSDRTVGADESRMSGSRKTRARRLAATASLAAAAIAGTATAALPATPAAASASAIIPVTKLTPNHSLVEPGRTVTFTVTEKTPTGTPVSSQATFEVHTKSGWIRVATKTLSKSGSAYFMYHPNVDHQYRVSFGAATVGGKAVEWAMTKKVVVRTDVRSRVVALAAKQKGKPYRYGADGPGSFDCSGLVKYVYGKVGINLPHNSSALLKKGKKISKSSAKPGDIVLVLSGSHATHAAIYAGNGYWWEAPHTGASVRHVKIWSKNIQFRSVV